MTDSIKYIARHLHSVATMQEIAQKAGLLNNIRELQNWQCERIMLSHQKLLAQPDCQPALDFFAQHLYGGKDFSQRDNAIQRVIPKAARFMPQISLQALASALHLNAVTFELDYAMAKQLKETTLNRDTYLAAYRACNNMAERQLQWRLFEKMISELALVVKLRGISALLLLSRKPAALAGLQNLHQFIDSGYRAFKGIHDIESFVASIVQVEQSLHAKMSNPNMPNPLPSFGALYER